MVNLQGSTTKQLIKAEAASYDKKGHNTKGRADQEAIKETVKVKQQSAYLSSETEKHSLKHLNFASQLNARLYEEIEKKLRSCSFWRQFGLRDKEPLDLRM